MLHLFKHKDEKKYGDYHTKLQSLDICDAIAESIRTGRRCRILLDLPPADSRCCHPPGGRA